jgi:hypothetical protein
VTWVKLDDGFDEHPAIATLTGEAVKLLVFSMTYCGRNLTDGFVPDHKVALLSVSAKPKHVDELVATGRWVKVDGGYQLPSFLDFNPSREKILTEREQSAERVRKHRESRRSNAVGNGVTNGEVIRSRPDPTRSIDSYSYSSGGEDRPVEKPASLEVVKEQLDAGRTALKSSHPRRAS